MGQLVGCIHGIAAACAALDMPIVSGNVSLYNETEGRAILPTPTIGGGRPARPRSTGLIRMAPRDGDRLLLLGETRGHLGQSALLAEVFGREEGDAPPVDLAAERAAGEFLRAANAAGLIAAAHDLSDGGLAVAAAEMALAGGDRRRGRRRRPSWPRRPGSSARTRAATSSPAARRRCRRAVELSRPGAARPGRAGSRRRSDVRRAATCRLGARAAVGARRASRQRTRTGSAKLLD